MISHDTSLVEAFHDVAERLQRSTVQVSTRGQGAGSGVIWSQDGLIVTNAHVVRGPSAQVELSDGRKFEATVIARDPERDLAALTIPAADLPAAPLANSDELRVGQLVAAVGNPLGLTGAMTVGIIHAIAPAEGHGRRPWVQADITLLPGNSGGPLADAAGRVIGINSMVAGGLGLAVPSNAVTQFLAGGRPKLGVVLQAVVVAAEDGRRQPGLLITEVSDGSAAQQAGLMIGDVLIGAGGKAFQNAGSLATALSDIQPGRVVRFDVVRGGRRMTVDVSPQPADPPTQAAA